MKKPTKLQVSVQYRDYVLPILREKGEWQSVSGMASKVLILKENDFWITLMTPFNKLPQTPQINTFQEAALFQNAPAPLPYLMDIFDMLGKSKKVLSMEWDEDSGEARLISFRRGEWEDRLKAMNATAS